MEVIYIKKKEFKSKKTEENYYIITTMINDENIQDVYVDENTYHWFDEAVCGDEIPQDFCSLDLYTYKNELRSRLVININK